VVAAELNVAAGSASTKYSVTESPPSSVGGEKKTLNEVDDTKDTETAVGAPLTTMGFSVVVTVTGIPNPISFAALTLT
jgi:hypothetical protein